MRRTYRYRLYPTRKQREALEAQLRDACNLYNAALEHRRTAYNTAGDTISFYDQCSELKHLRATGLLDRSSNSWSQQDVLRRLDRAFQAFFRRLKTGEKPGFPRFRPVSRYRTLTWSFAGNAGGCGVVERRLRLQGVGHVKVKWHREIPQEAVLRTVQVKRQGDRWYACFSLDNVPPRSLPKTGNVTGLDLGITSFAALSNGELIEGPCAFREGRRKLRRAARKVSRRRKGSNRRRKAVANLARQRERESNRRRDHAHKTARDLVNRFDLIAIENLNLKGLSRGMLAREVHDQAWGMFVSCLTDKAEEAGRKIVLVDPKHTSQQCSNCGTVKIKTLADRVHHCDCGYTADRDVNAARNILARANGPDGAIRRKRSGEETLAVA